MEELIKVIDFPEVFNFLRHPARYKVAWGGRGGARSWSFARALIAKGAHEELFILCAREFQNSISDSVHKLLANQIEMMGYADCYTVLNNSIRCRSGTEFVFWGLKQNITKIKSIEGIDVCWVEEAEKVSQNSWDVLIPTIRKDGSEIWVTFNPDLITDPTYKKFITEDPPGSVVHQTSWKDNPWFPEELRKEKDYLYRVDPDKANWVWGGECRSHSDAQIMKGKWYIDAFGPEENKKGQMVYPPSWFGPYFGADWGFAKSPTVLVRFWIATTGDSWDLMIEYEAYGVEVDINDTPELFDHVPDSRKYVIRADSARPETINYMVNHGFKVISAPKWPGCVEDGISWIRSCNKIIIHDRCIHMADEARNYSYKIDKLTGDILPDVVQLWDHCFIGSTLITTDKGQKRIDHIKIGDRVLTLNGFHRVKKVWNNGIKKVRPYWMLLDMGFVYLRCTSDHKIRTVNGWKRISDIQKGDIVFRHKNLMGKSIIYTMGSDILHAVEKGFMLRFGNFIKELFQKAIVFITKITTRQIMIYQTSAYCQLDYIAAIQLRNDIKTTRRHSGDFGKKGLSQQKHGTKQKKAGNGTESMGGYAGLTKRGLRCFVRFVEKNMKHLFQTDPNTAITTARLLRLGEGGKQSERVYDLSIEGEHEYFANGILVSNCWDAIRYGASPMIAGDQDETIIYDEHVNISAI